MNAADVIDNARSLDGSFSRKRHGDRVCLEFLTRYQRTLAGEVLTRDSRVISSEISFDLPPDPFNDGVVLQVETAPETFEPLQWDRLHGIDLEYRNGDRITCEIVPWKQRAYVEEFPTVAQRENTLLLMGREAWWSPFVAMHLEYAPTPGTVAAMDDVLIFPDSAFGCVVLQLGAELCRRDLDACKRKTLPAEGLAAEQAWLDLIDERNDVEIGRVRRVFS